MADLRIVPKPDGFDFTDRRSSDSSDASLWRPIDALYDAHGQVEKGNVECIAVIWKERKADGGTEVRYRCAGPKGSIPALLLEAMGWLMGWR